MCIDKLQVVYHSLIFDYLSFSPSLVHPSYTHFKNIIEPISIFLLTKCRITGWVWDRDDERQKGQVDPAADGLDGEAEAESGRSSGLIFSPFSIFCWMLPHRGWWARWRRRGLRSRRTTGWSNIRSCSTANPRGLRRQKARWTPRWNSDHNDGSNNNFFSGETTSSGLWCRGACACLCQEEGEKCNQCHRGCTSKSSRLSPKKSYSTADQYFASR